MIDKIMFETPVKMINGISHGVLIYTPYENETVVRMAAIDKNNHVFDSGAIDIPLEGLDKLRKVLSKIIKGGYEKEAEEIEI